MEGHLDAITSTSFSPDGFLIATTCHNGDFRLWRLENNVHVQDDAHDLGIQCCDFSQNLEPIPNVITDNIQNYLLATCGNDSLVKLWRITLTKVRYYLLIKFLIDVHWYVCAEQTCTYTIGD